MSPSDGHLSRTRGRRRAARSPAALRDPPSDLLLVTDSGRISWPIARFAGAGVGSWRCERADESRAGPAAVADAHRGREEFIITVIQASAASCTSAGAGRHLELALLLPALLAYVTCTHAPRSPSRVVRCSAAFPTEA